MTSRRRPRWLHRLWARARGYFWAPCPWCGQMFGGHEVAEGWAMADNWLVPNTSPASGELVCWRHDW